MKTGGYFSIYSKLQTSLQFKAINTNNAPLPFRQPSPAMTGLIESNLKTYTHHKICENKLYNVLSLVQNTAKTFSVLMLFANSVVVWFICICSLLLLCIIMCM